MKKGIYLFFLCMLVLAGFGCGGRYINKDIAITQPENKLAIPHPVEYEKAGVKKITVFNSIMDAGLLTEAYINGQEIPSGNWPCVGYNPKTVQKVNCNYFIVGPTPWGDTMLEHHILDAPDDIGDYKFINFTADSQRAFSLTGLETIELRKEKKEDGKEVVTVFDYRPNRLKTDKDYEKDFYQTFGFSLPEIDFALNEAVKASGGNPEMYNGTTEYIIGTPEYEKYKRELSLIFKVDHLTPGKKIMMGNQTLDEYAHESVQNNRFSPSANAGRSVVVSAAMVAAFFDPTPTSKIIAGSQLLGPMAGNLMDNSWRGYYSGAKAERFDLAPALRYQKYTYQKMVLERNQIILDQKQAMMIQQQVIECFKNGGNSCLDLMHTNSERR